MLPSVGFPQPTECSLKLLQLLIHAVEITFYVHTGLDVLLQDWTCRVELLLACNNIINNLSTPIYTLSAATRKESFYKTTQEQIKYLLLFDLCY